MNSKWGVRELKYLFRSVASQSLYQTKSKLRMKKTLLLTNILLWMFCAQAQTNWNWAKKGGGASNDYGYVIKKLSDDKIVSCATVASTSVAFSPYTIPNASGLNNGFIIIQDTVGGFYSPFSPTGYGECGVFAMDVDTSQNVYVTGYVNGIVVFGDDTINASTFSRVMFAAKLAKVGQYSWQWEWAYKLSHASTSSTMNTADAIKVTPDGSSFYIGGRSHQGSGTYLTNGDSTTSKLSIANQDGYIVKYSSSGAYQWGINLDAFGTVTGQTTCHRMELDGQGNLIAAGEWIGSSAPLSFVTPMGTTVISANSQSGKRCFLAKISASNGSMLWARNAFDLSPIFTYAVGTSLNGLAVDKSTNQIYVTCLTGGNFPNGSMFVKYNPTADTVVYNTSTVNVYYSNVTLDNANSPVLCGNLVGTATINATNYTSAGSNDIFVGRVNPATGAWNMFQRAGGGDVDNVNSICTSGFSTYVVGSFKSAPMSFPGIGTTLSATSNTYDVFMAKIVLPEPCIAPDVTQQPSAVNQCSGKSFSLSVAASGNGLTYKWQKGGVNLNGNGANTATYSIAAGSVAHSGSYRCIVSNTCGADTTVVVSVAISAPLQSNMAQTICNGSSYTFAGQTLTQSGTYKDTLQTAGGCDSIVTLNLTVLNKIETTVNAGICNGQSYTFNGQQLTQAGQYFDTLQTVLGCDSFVTLNLTVNSFVTGSASAEICAGDSYTFNGQQLTQGGQYMDTLVSAGGCDSIVTLTLTVNQLPQPTIAQNGNVLSTQVFASYQWQFNGSDISNATSQSHTANQNGNYTVAVTDVNGCSAYSSVVTVTGVGIKEVSSFRSEVYPNPATTVLQVSSEEALLSIAIVDLFGRKVFTQAVNEAKQTQIDVSKMAASTYFIHLTTTNGNTAVKSFVKQ